ncbi:MAG: HAD-IB family hydrolase [Sphingobacteriales bacterium]|nr:MAG: HAD-IB family hydrolase [Sphingobacteriales bacterium]
MLQKAIAFFDFDGTITNKDTMLALATFSKGKAGFLLGMIKLSPSLVALKLNLLSAQKAKQLFLKYFFGGMDIAGFQHLCETFCAEMLPALIRKDAWNAIEKHRLNGDTIMVVSASAENWIAPWCHKHNIPYLGTRLQIENNIVTGNIEGLNCNGKEKVSRIKEIFNLADYENIYAYGDSSGDEAMLAIATQPGFRVFVD